MLVIFSFIYFQSAWFRKDDFNLRLRQKALTVYKLLVEENQIDSSLLRIIDSSSLDKLYEEKIMVFDRNDHRIYTSPGGRAVTITPELLHKIRKKDYYTFSEGETEAVGIAVLDEPGEGIVIASAFDKFGKRKLSNLLFMLSISWLGSILITGFIAYFYVKGIFRPLDNLNEKIQEVTEGNLKQRVNIGPGKNELSQMAANFNKMLDRLEQSFEVQKSFLQFASHELRTPLSNLLLQTETALNKDISKEQFKNVLISLYDDQKYMVDMVNSILSLSKYNQQELTTNLQAVRVDELLFEIADELKTYHPEYEIRIDFSSDNVLENELVVKGIPGLLKVLFTNLIINGCIYSLRHSIDISITPGSNQILISFINDGPVVPLEERDKLFMPFFRGTNAARKRGHGLGLSICKRIIDVHKGRLFYNVTEEGYNCFNIILFNF